MCDEYLDPGCGGSGVLHCYCGGDFCVCTCYGTGQQDTECPGCEDCEDQEDDYDD